MRGGGREEEGICFSYEDEDGRRLDGQGERWNIGVLAAAISNTGADDQSASKIPARPLSRLSLVRCGALELPVVG